MNSFFFDLSNECSKALLATSKLQGSFLVMGHFRFIRTNIGKTLINLNSSIERSRKLFIEQTEIQSVNKNDLNKKKKQLYKLLCLDIFYNFLV